MSQSSATTMTYTRAPAPDYAAAMRQLAALEALDGSDVQSVCRSQALTHGAMTDHAIVLLHGMTNCPQQFHAFAPLLFARGYNVLIPRETRNGLGDRDTNALGGLTLDELTMFSDRVADIARGLGRRVTVMGISAGGVMAAWLAQFRDDIAAAMVIAPSLGILPNLPRAINGPANRAVTGIFNVLPNFMTQRLRPFTAGPPQGYRGFATRGLGAIMRQGQVVLDVAKTAPPATCNVLMVLNRSDPAVNNTMAEALVDRWRKQGAPVATHYFTASEKLIHDIIDPEQPDQRVDLVYPILLDLLTKLDVSDHG
ncbi:MAG TPA: alpha/beta fold hydrolase [Ktedonobacterales bacterium]|nr:alpha/beta fold hydrolase [Ktedonobacterales bacterium]